MTACVLGSNHKSGPVITISSATVAGMCGCRVHMTATACRLISYAASCAGADASDQQPCAATRRPPAIIYTHRVLQ